MKPTTQKSLTDRASRQARALIVLKAAAGGASLSAAAKEAGITTSSAIEVAQEVFKSVLKTERWGSNEQVQTALRKTLHQVLTEHYELVDEIVATVRKELDMGSLAPWESMPAHIDSQPRKKVRPVTVVTWTEAMEARLGKDTDVKIADELGLTCRLVQQRRKTLGIDSFRSVFHGQAQGADSFVREKSEFALACVWMGWAAQPRKAEQTSAR